jgi:hypothetical protein
MSSLSAHLRQTEDHSRLRFHPGCPVCRRDRLAGSLSGDELVSRRVQAAVAAGLLAFSTSGVSVAMASEPDEVSDGTSEVVTPSDPSSSVDFEPGGEAGQLPDEAPLAPETAQAPVEDSEDLGALEPEPATDVAETVVNDVAAEAPPAPPRTPAAQPSPPASEPPQSEVAPEAADVPPEDVAPKAERAERRAARSSQDAVEPAAAPVPAAAPPAATPVPPEPPPPDAAAPVTTRVVSGADTGRAAAGDRFHTVRAGESLWSIATDLLGERASTARVAREVNRLWELNDDRIATGSPDLIYAGTRLTLR